ncbi:MAG TPA: hypothetical protein PKO06_22870, partial [Candidatus Ozemobacteraceae bacterium]|nr:hypothetical protein [Candidatus Ozemobacteraceae bacterium]
MPGAVITTRSPRFTPRFHRGIVLAILLFLPVFLVSGAGISRFQEYPDTLARQARRTLPVWSPTLIPELSWFLADRFDHHRALVLPPLKPLTSETAANDSAAAGITI